MFAVRPGVSTKLQCTLCTCIITIHIFTCTLGPSSTFWGSPNAVGPNTLKGVTCRCTYMCWWGPKAQNSCPGFAPSFFWHIHLTFYVHVYTCTCTYVNTCTIQYVLWSVQCTTMYIHFVQCVKACMGPGAWACVRTHDLTPHPSPAMRHSWLGRQWTWQERERNQRKNSVNTRTVNVSHSWVTCSWLIYTCTYTCTCTCICTCMCTYTCTVVPPSWGISLISDQPSFHSPSLYFTTSLCAFFKLTDDRPLMAVSRGGLLYIHVHVYSELHVHVHVAGVCYSLVSLKVK